GAGICVASNSNTVIINCQISDNQTVGDFQYGSYRHAYGGGISCADSTIAVYDTVITANKVKGGRKGSYSSISTWGSDSLGGGLYVSASTGSHITNCLVANNETVVAVGDEEWIGPNYGDSRGAGIYCGGSLTISNCTVFGNDTDPTGTGQGGGGGGVYGPATIIDSIIRANLSPSQLSGVTSVMYSDIQGGWGGDGNIDADPLFVTGPALFGDYYLSQTAAGQGANSLCVDAGSDTAANLGMDVLTTAADNALDAGTVDMGYHYNVAVSIADFDNSGRVDLIDLAILASQWQDIPGIPSADIAPNGPDGTVDEDDFDEFSKRWLWN
ncbi:MAG: hypothetical protein KAR47_11860, partial [Planctomycetes bacterium]|nr:hypothetical protein [Planctomycetota bacterium]